MSAANENTLFIESGNSAWKAARFEKPNGENLLSRLGELSLCGRGNTFTALYEWLELQPERRIVLATVGAEQEAVDLIAKLNRHNYQVHRAETAQISGFEHCYTEPSRLGVDRWLTMVALRGNEQPVVIIDAGTAITLDLMDVGGKHLGGWIAPGFHLMQDALVGRSNRLKAKQQAPSGTIGINTEDAIGLGCKAALQGFCEQALVAAKETLAEQAFDIYLLGGSSQLLNSDRWPNCELRPLLVLEGLYAWWQEQL